MKLKINKVVEIIISLMVNLKIKDKRIKYTVLGILGLALAASTQITNIEGEVGTINPNQNVIEQVINDVLGSVLGNL